MQTSFYQIWTAFRVFDKNSDGMVTKAEFRCVPSNHSKINMYSAEKTYVQPNTTLGARPSEARPLCISPYNQMINPLISKYLIMLISPHQEFCNSHDHTTN